MMEKFNKTKKCGKIKIQYVPSAISDDIEKIKFFDGTTRYFVKGVLHREDGPAVEGNCRKRWYINGKLHRKDGPAIEGPDNYYCWYLYGEKHRNPEPDGSIKPTEYKLNNYEKWFNFGVLHRDVSKDGVHRPAFIDNKKNIKKWFLNGKLHRVDGPAVTNKKIVCYYLNGELHRVDGPAIIDDMCEKWFLNGKLHRVEDRDLIHKPSTISKDKRSKNWYWHNMKHRLQGPAKLLERRDGSLSTIGTDWYLWDNEYTKEEHGTIVKIFYEFTKRSAKSLISSTYKNAKVIPNTFLGMCQMFDDYLLYR